MSTRVLPALIRPTAVPAGLQIRKVTAATATGANPTFNVDLGTVTAGRRLLVGVLLKDGIFSGINYATGLAISGGVSLAEEVSCRAAQSFLFGNEYKSQVYWADNTSDAGITTFELTQSGNDNAGIVVVEIAGWNAVDWIGLVDGHNEGNASVETSVTTTAAGSLLFYFGAGQNAPASPAAGFTEDIDLNPAGSVIFASGHRTAPTVGSYTVGFSTNGSFGVGGCASIIEILAA